MVRFYDTPYGVWPLWTFSCGSVADGILFVPEGHMYSPPLFRGAKELAINTTDGTLVWSIMSFATTSAPAIADGIMTSISDYDNQIYTYGKGPTRIIVNAPSLGVTTSTPITITGAITDISAGSQQDGVASNFPNGLPAVSDASMSKWMEYVYMQQPCPSDVTGVPIDISVLDSNGNYRSIGSTTSDGSGTFAFTWTPDISGDYSVVASFAGSKSYYPSSAETHFAASEAAPTAAPTQAPPQSAADMYFVPAVAGIILAIAIVGAILAILLLRKRP
jgi:hypothetical protein